ncbi:hypothetical protein ACFX13_030261 [Malus domestica]|nr:dof zinc finger protein DOF2.1-like [Malus domestica]XP_050141424.1 dof zinc finger protein DOF2.1-like [Malus sylvestris]
MDPSSGRQQQQEMSTHSLDMLVGSKSQQQQQDRKPRPQPEQALKCPRCDSTNTKFCYYNNYSLSQPRYFCKSCRRYWTKGGTLRNVPVGGGCRKNKRSSSAAKRAQEQPLTPNSNPLPGLGYDSNDLTLAFARLQRQQSCGGQLGFDDHNILGNPNSAPGFLDGLRTGFLESHNGNFQNLYNYGFGNGNGNLGEVEDCGGGMGIHHPFEEATTTSTTNAVTVTTMKQELFNAQSESSNRVLWGFPWQMNGGDHHANMVGNGNHEYDSGRESWNGIASSWQHGLVHTTPLV